MRSSDLDGELMGDDFNDFGQGHTDAEIAAELDRLSPWEPNPSLDDRNGHGAASEPQLISRARFWPELKALPRPDYLVKGEFGAPLLER